MKCYKISKNVDIDNNMDFEIANTSTNSLNNNLANLGKSIIKNELFSSLPVLAVSMIIEKHNNKDVEIIESYEKLKKYSRCIDEEWKYNTLYVEHPKLKNALIPKKEYSSFILRDMIADIANYITNHFELYELTVGIVCSKSINANLTVPVNNIATSTKFDFDLSNNFCYHIEDTKININNNQNYWIDYFPHIKEAISSGAKRMDIVEETNINSSLEIELKGLGGGKIGGKNGVSFFINYSAK